jgi:3-methyl-2-oxobutanoate hydroxymethyltransferase
MMIEHSKSVKMGVKKSLLVVDMPYNTYKNSKEAIQNAKKIMLKTKCDAVKLEGGKKITNIVKNLIKNKIPVMGHLGVLPQTQVGKFKYKGKKLAEKNKILNEAKLLESAGVFSIVLECIETSLAKQITNILSVPTIGIGASHYCDGQVLVTDDFIGLNTINARFVKRYSNIKKIINSAVSQYAKDVKKKNFPKKKHSY